MVLLYGPLNARMMWYDTPNTDRRWNCCKETLGPPTKRTPPNQKIIAGFTGQADVGLGWWNFGRRNTSSYLVRRELSLRVERGRLFILFTGSPLYRSWLPPTRWLPTPFGVSRYFVSLSSAPPIFAGNAVRRCLQHPTHSHDSPRVPQ